VGTVAECAEVAKCIRKEGDHYVLSLDTNTAGWKWAKDRLCGRH
jgi:hypothetical protein